MKRPSVIPLLAAVCLLTSCASPQQKSDPEAVRFAKPASGQNSGRLIPDGNIHSPWEWILPTPQGSWKVKGKYAGTTEGDRYEAAVTFPDGARLSLPVEAVTLACRATSEDPELTAWTNAEGVTFLCLGGTITATHSEGIFAIKNQRLLGWLARESTEQFPSRSVETSEQVHWFAPTEGIP